MVREEMHVLGSSQRLRFPSYRVITLMRCGADRECVGGADQPIIGSRSGSPVLCIGYFRVILSDLPFSHLGSGVNWLLVLLLCGASIVICLIPHSSSAVSGQFQCECAKNCIGSSLAICNALGLSPDVCPAIWLPSALVEPSNGTGNFMATNCPVTGPVRQF